MTQDLEDIPEPSPESTRAGARARADATVAIAVAPGASPAPPPSLSQLPLYSYKPQAAPAQSSHGKGELIVPSVTTVGAILEHVRRPPSERMEIESRIASGGMGTIEVAVDRGLDRRIAIKTLHPHLRADEGALRMFLREARLTGLLDHPHIVPVYDLGEREKDGTPFFAMKLVEGQTLAALIHSLPRGVVDTATLYTLLDVVARVCDALAFAHSRGVLHCDVKPANVMVGEFGQVFLMDWGIARLVTPPATAAEQAPGTSEPRRDAAEDSGPIIGTPCYMSPEQARGDRRKLDERSDVFLLGAMLYELLTRRAPYASGDRTETLALAAACAFPAPRRVAGEIAVPLELERIVMRCMAKDRDARYPSVAALKEDLVRFMRGGVEFPRRTYRTGDVVIRHGEVGDEVYIIVEGLCEVQKELPDGLHTIQTLGPGDVFGETAILTHGPRTATVVATAPTTVLIVTSRVLEQEMAALKPWMARILTSLAGRFRDIDTVERSTLPSSALPPARIANQLLMHLVAWGEHDGGRGRSMSWSLAARDIEAQVGVSPPALFGAISAYAPELELDLSADRLIARDIDALRSRVASDMAAVAAR